MRQACRWAGRPAYDGHAPRKIQQRRVDRLVMRPADVVRSAVDSHKLEPANQAGRRLAVDSEGRIRSAEPWIASIGTPIFGRSPRKSVSHVSTHAKLAIGDAAAATWKEASQTRPLIRSGANVSVS